MQGQRQVLSQQQRLNLSPQLVQSIKLMALPYAELRERIIEEVERNPALEIVNDPFESAEITAQQGPETVTQGMAAPASPDEGPGDGFEAFVEPDEFADRLGPATPLDTNLYGGMSLDAGLSMSDRSGNRGETDSDEHRDFIEGALHRDETLQERLLEQLGELTLSARVRSLAELVIQNLNPDGFHIVDPAELPGAEGDVLEAALDAVRGLDPAGCATRDWRESLLVQARLIKRARGEGNPDPALDRAIEIIDRHFETLERGRPDALVKALSRREDVGFTLDLDGAEEILDIVRSLDPFPGRAFGSGPVSAVIPDVIVRRAEDGYAVVINDEEIPVLGISPFFMELESERAGPGGAGDSVGEDASKARDFARESVKEARWFIGTVERRNLTILKLVRAIVVFQRDFFTHGPSRLAPLRMRDVAEEIGMHEATVSRAANGKYLQCEWGVFELRHFFSNQVGSARTPTVDGREGSGGAGLYSKEGVKEIIRSMIADSREALSDQKIADLLATKGIKIARRTVAKYRGELTIGSSFDR